jgi:hypothetical protein
MTDPYREPDAPPPRWTEKELDEIAGVGEAQLQAAMEKGEVRVTWVKSLLRRLRVSYWYTANLPPPVLPTACNHAYGCIFGRNKCRHCGQTRKQIEERHAQSV